LVLDLGRGDDRVALPYLCRPQPLPVAARHIDAKFRVELGEPFEAEFGAHSPAGLDARVLELRGLADGIKHPDQHEHARHVIGGIIKENRMALVYFQD
jgi:hypothetical protein